MVRAESVSMGVAVSEQSTLEHLVRAGLDTRHHVSWIERSLLYVGKVILWILVEH